MKKLIDNEKGFGQLVPMIMAVVIVFALLFVGAFVVGQMSQSLEDTFPTESERTESQNDTINTMGNISENWDSGISLMQVTIIISILAGAISAIFLFTKFGR